MGTVTCKSCTRSAICLAVGYDEMLEQRLQRIESQPLGRGWLQWEEARKGIPWNCPEHVAQRKENRREASQRIGEAANVRRVGG